MQAACTKCGATYEFDAGSIPPTGYDAQCTNCAAVFFVAPPPPPAPPVITAPPPPAAPARISVSCNACGALYQFAPADIPEVGYDAQCTHCQAVFFVSRVGDQPKPAPAPAAPAPVLLAQPKADLVIELGPTPDMNLASFELLSKGQVVHRHTGPSQVIKLPAALLVAGAHLSWKLNYSGSKYEGSFRVEPASTLVALQQTMLKEAQGDPDEFVVKLRVASGLSKEGYFWDARELIRVALAQ